MALPDNPLTRIEQYLANIAGQDTSLPKVPLTRIEQYLDYIAKNGGGAAGDYPLVKTYTAESAVTGQFDLDFDKPLKAVRVLITGVSNSDVSAAEKATVTLGVGANRTEYLKKAMWANIVSNGAVTAYIDSHIDRQMDKLISSASIGTVAESNGYLNSVQTNIVPGAGYDKIWKLSIRPDATNGISVTTGMTIKVYGLEASP